MRFNRSGIAKLVEPKPSNLAKDIIKNGNWENKKTNKNSPVVSYEVCQKLHFKAENTPQPIWKCFKKNLLYCINNRGYLLLCYHSCCIPVDTN